MTDVQTLGALGGECFLVTSPQSAVLIDTGFNYYGDTLVSELQSILGGRLLDYILLTHSHYDHVSGCAAVKRAYPGAVVAAHPIVAELLQKEKVRGIMRQLNQDAAGGAPYADTVDEIRVDKTVTDGDVIKTSDMTIEVLETPGHTRCCISFYFREENMLALTETTGMMRGSVVEDLFIVSYKSACKAIDRCAAYGANRLIIPHYKVIEGELIALFFDKSRRAVQERVNYVLSRHAQGIDPAQIVEEYTAATYVGHRTRVQPRSAFLLNAEATIRHILREAAEGAESQPA